jgi:glycosyltransferase involved in cell wall biosynthesis
MKKYKNKTNIKKKSVQKYAIIIPHGFEPNYTLGFVKGLAANGVSICVISSDIDHQRILKCGIPSVNLRNSQERNRPITIKIMTLIKYYINLIIHLIRHRKNVIHFTGIFRNEIVIFEGFLLSLCFKALSSTFIYTVHNVLPHNKEDSRLFKVIYRWIYRIPDLLLVHTSLAKKQLMEIFRIPKNKIIVISIGLNEEIPITKITRKEARERLGYAIEDKIILFFGKGDLFKGLDILIEAFQRIEMKATKLLISAWFPNSSYRQFILDNISSSKRKEDIVLFEQFISNDKVEVYFKCADVLVLPYRNIYQSGVVFLSYRFGLPLIATDVGAIKEFVEEDMGIIVRKNDPDELSKAIENYFNNAKKFSREEIIKKAEKYRWEKICQSIVSLYQ